MEFVVTSMYNPGKLSVSCQFSLSLLSHLLRGRKADAKSPSVAYLLDNGKAYAGAHVAGLLEYVLEETYFPSEYRAYKHFGGTMFIGGLSL